MMSVELTNQVALVTGSSRGLGRGIALALARAGARIGINYLNNKTAAQEVAAQIRQLGSEAILVQADVCDYDQVEQMIARILEKWGKIDLLVNNVGNFLQKQISEIEISEWHGLIASNLHSAFYCCKATLPHMRQRKYGRIVNIGLANANRIQSYQRITPYAIAKTGLVILTKSMAVEEGPFGISVNVVSPGLMDNGSLSSQELTALAERVPMGHVGTAKDLSDAILFLASPKAVYITGTEIIVSGGWGV